MTQYRQFIPGHLIHETGLADEITENVKTALVDMVARPGQSSSELLDQCTITIHPAHAFVGCSTRNDSDEEGFWIVGEIDQDTYAWYMEHDFDPIEYEIGSGHSFTEHEPVDMDPEEYSKHLAEKEARHGVR